MANLTSIEVVHRLYISITAMGFNMILFIMLGLYNRNYASKNKRFVQLALVLLVGNLISCISVVLRRAEAMHPTAFISVSSYMVSTLVNIYVTYYFARYVESYFREWVSPPRILVRINSAILILATASTLLLCLFGVEIVMDSSAPAGVAPWIRIVYGYGLELYNIIYTIIYFTIHRKFLNRRSFVTAIVAFSVTVGGIICQIFFPDVLVNYFGAVMGLYLFYFGVEAPDYRKLMETLRELNAAREAADQANLSKSYFLANMSHEIRTPINAVMGMNEMILRESRDETITSYAKNVESAGRNLLSIINDILDFSKIEAGKMEIIPAPYHVSSMINDTSNMISFRTGAKGLDFHIEVDPLIPDELYGDEVRIRQIMVNLLTNSVKYTETGNVTLQVEKEDISDGIELVISVSDTGIGIKEEDMDKLFGQFERVDLTHNKTVEGTGLGLAITHELVRMMSGTIDVESTYGKGSRFTVRIPQKVVSGATVGDYRERADKNRSPSGTYKESFHAPEAEVLVVDDTRVNLMVAKALLKKTEVRVDTATSGPEGIKMAAEKKYDLIFMDQRMPIMDGTQALHEIRAGEDGPNALTPVICLTADAISGARERYISEGFTDYLTKPIEGGSIEELLIRYLPEEKIIWKRESAPEEKKDE